MKSKLPAADPKPLNGHQRFFNGAKKENFTLSDFWSWSFSSLLNNITRGHLAEFIVAKALGVAGMREVWAAFDLTMPHPKGGKVKVEVKSAAYLQEWEQDCKSAIQFNVRKTRAINKRSGLYTGAPKRHADVYVLAHFKEEEDKAAVKSLNLDQWCFYVVPTKSFNKRTRSQQSITLNSLINEKDKLKMQQVGYAGLRQAVIDAAS